MDRSDAELVRQAAIGEHTAFDELVRRHRPAVVRFAALMVGDMDEAESLAQEALTRAFSQLSMYRPESPFSSWLRGIALNLCRNHLRDRARHAKLLAPNQLAEAQAPEGRRQGVLSGILRREMGDRLLQAVTELPFPLREAFVLRYLENLEYAEISSITGLAAGTLRVRAHRARTLLQNSLGSIVDTWLRQGPIV
jgi:RNA polymerase sigma-70 factor (ECF subfamily)